MGVRDWLKGASDNGTKPVNQIVFAGERFDVMSVRREWVVSRIQAIFPVVRHWRWNANLNRSRRPSLLTPLYLSQHPFVTMGLARPAAQAAGR
jgi:hypothetical protein